MNIGVNEYGLNSLKISYSNHETIEIDITSFFNDTSNLSTLYSQINEYLLTVPDVIQKEVYETIYRVCSTDYSQSYTDYEYITKLEIDIDKIAKLLSYEDFKIWMRYREQYMVIPENILEVYVHDPDMNTTEEKTYIRKEYVDLISLIVFIRALSPLYINYYNYVKQVTNHYCYKTYMLFVRSNVYSCTEIEKLKRYIEVNQQTLVGNTKNEHLVIGAGLSDDDVTDSLVSEIIFNKLITIDFFNKKCNIISFIFQTIKYKGSFITADSMSIRGKNAVSSNKEDMSYFEDYRKTTEVPIGTIVEIQHALSNMGSLLLGLGYSSFNYERYSHELSIDARLVNLSSGIVKTSSSVDKLHLYLLGWFLNKVINPRALFYIEEIKIIELLIFAKIILLENGHTFMAALFGSVKSEQNNHINLIIRNSLNKSLLTKLNTHYGFVIEEDKPSPIERTVSEISKEIVNNSWLVSGSIDKLERVTANGYIVIPNNINDVLCEYIDFINN